MRILIVGNEGGTNVGWSLFRAAKLAGHEAGFANALEAARGPRWLKRVAWHFFDHRPPRLGSFSRAVRERALRDRPELLIATGAVPITAGDLARIRAADIRTANFTTDDPWSPISRANWFLRALPAYDVVFTPRRANIADLQRAGCRHVEFLPFGYDPELCFPEEISPVDTAALASDVIFVGGADDGRAALIADLARDIPNVSLYGSFWERYPATRALTRGQAAPETIRRATRAARVSLCLVRHSNRDGHVMRSFEMAAMGACMLVEDTAEHRELFGDDGERVMFFVTPRDMTLKAQILIADEALRRRLSTAVMRHVTAGCNTYADRLSRMMTASLQGARVGL
jgi:spore maturation protein CgeB